MASSISTLLATEKLHAALPLADPTSLYKTFQSLFLIECPTDDATTLQNIQLNAAFLEYLSSQRVSRIKELLKAWRAQSLKDEVKEEGEGQEKGEGKREEKGEKDEKDDGGNGVLEYTDKETLNEVEKHIRDGVNDVCVYFDGQEVEAIVKMEEVRRKVDGILEKATSAFWPSFICQPREVV